jgi:hypothetical protein
MHATKVTPHTYCTQQMQPTQQITQQMQHTRDGQAPRDTTQLRLINLKPNLFVLAGEKNRTGQTAQKKEVVLSKTDFNLFPRLISIKHPSSSDKHKKAHF